MKMYVVPCTDGSSLSAISLTHRGPTWIGVPIQSMNWGAFWNNSNSCHVWKGIQAISDYKPKQDSPSKPMSLLNNLYTCVTGDGYKPSIKAELPLTTCPSHPPLLCAQGSCGATEDFQGLDFVLLHTPMYMCTNVSKNWSWFQINV